MKWRTAFAAECSFGFAAARMKRRQRNAGEHRTSLCMPASTAGLDSTAERPRQQDHASG